MAPATKDTAGRLSSALPTQPPRRESDPRPGGLRIPYPVLRPSGGGRGGSRARDRGTPGRWGGRPFETSERQHSRTLLPAHTPSSPGPETLTHFPAIS